jgi:hypothetical protein
LRSKQKLNNRFRAVPVVRQLTRKRGRLIVDLADSGNLYLTPKQGAWYEDVLTDPRYQETVTHPLACASDAIPYLLNLFTRASSSSLAVVDLGPATAKESIRKLNQLSRVIEVQSYTVVDVNPRLLSNVARGGCGGIQNSDQGALQEV